MKTNFSKFVTVCLTLTLISSVMFCCCVTDVVHAKMESASCHQHNDQEKSSSHNSDNCSCDQSFIILKNDHVLSYQLSYSLMDIFQEAAHSIEQTLPILIAQPPPLWLDQSSLYLKHSVLRI